MSEVAFAVIAVLLVDKVGETSSFDSFDDDGNLIEDGNADDESDTRRDAIFLSATEDLLDNTCWTINLDGPSSRIDLYYITRALSHHSAWCRNFRE